MTPPTQLIMLTGASAGSGKSTLLRNLEARYRSEGQDVMVIDEDAVWGRRRLDATPVDTTTASPLFRQLLHEDHPRREHLTPAAVLDAFGSLVAETSRRDAVWLQDWSWTDLLAVTGWEETVVAETSRRLRQVAAGLLPRVVYLRVDAQQALSRALVERGPVWFNRYAGWPLEDAVTVSRVQELAAIKRDTEPTTVQALAGWNVTFVDAATALEEVDEAVWRQLRMTTRS